MHAADPTQSADVKMMSLSCLSPCHREHFWEDGEKDMHLAFKVVGGYTAPLWALDQTVPTSSPSGINSSVGHLILLSPCFQKLSSPVALAARVSGSVPSGYCVLALPKLLHDDSNLFVGFPLHSSFKLSLGRHQLCLSCFILPYSHWHVVFLTQTSWNPLLGSLRVCSLSCP